MRVDQTRKRTILLALGAALIFWLAVFTGYLFKSVHRLDLESGVRVTSPALSQRNEERASPKYQERFASPAYDESANLERLEGYVQKSANLTGQTLANNISSNQRIPPAIDLERYPTLDCPAAIAVANEFAVQFSLTEKLFTPDVAIEKGEGKTPGRLSLSLPEREYWTIDVVISAPDFLFRNGENRSTLRLAQHGDSAPVIFFLRARPISEAEKKAPISITLWHEGNYLAKISRTITIVDSAAALVNRTTISSPRVTPVSLDFSRLSPDMTIYVLGDDDLILSSKWHRPVATRFQLDNSFSDWMSVQYGKFSQLGGERAELSSENSASSSTLSYAERAHALMRGAGRELYSKFAPQIFRDAFCQLVRTHAAEFKTIEIYSSKPDLPWELMRPACPDAAGKLQEHQFLGLEFAVGRWHLSSVDEISELPPQTLALNKLIVIAPEYKEKKTLPSQRYEIEALRTFSGYERLPGQLSLMRVLFNDFPEGIIYFTGHGVMIPITEKVNEYSIELEDGQLDLTTWRGMINPQNKNHPLFIFNACDSGQTQRIANFIDGWAPAVLEAGASGYIGTLWPVSDKGAAEFGVSFSRLLGERLQGGPASIAEVLMETRRKFLEDGDPTFLAYIYYGDARLKLRKPAQ